VQSAPACGALGVLNTGLTEDEWCLCTDATSFLDVSVLDLSVGTCQASCARGHWFCNGQNSLADFKGCFDANAALWSPNLASCTQMDTVENCTS